MKRWVALLAVLGLFLVGVLVGVVGTHVFYHHKIERGGGLVGFATELFAQNLERRLDLDEGQKRQLEEILADTHREFGVLHQDVGPRAMTILRRMQGRIEEMLTPQQAEEYRRFQEGSMKRFHRFLLHR
jgi:hypothetical protein